MRVLFIDESGCTGALPRGSRRIQPLLCIAGVSIDHDRIAWATRDWVDLKRKFHPNLLPAGAKAWDWQRAEIKGSEVRKASRADKKRKRRQAIGFLDKVFDLMTAHKCELSARVYIKAEGQPFDGRAVYASGLQGLCASFDSRLHSLGSTGLVIADSRAVGDNSAMSHSVFTQKYRRNGDAYPRLVEVPVFGHSDNHAMLQIADVFASSILFPICGYQCLHKRLSSIHVHGRFGELLERFQPRLVALEQPSQPRGLRISDLRNSRATEELCDRETIGVLPKPVVPSLGHTNKRIARQS
ncbi:MAG: DUF3800 domain-containing protein [Planctomycetota bacterium]